MIYNENKYKIKGSFDKEITISNTLNIQLQSIEISKNNNINKKLITYESVWTDAIEVGSSTIYGSIVFILNLNIDITFLPYLNIFFISGGMGAGLCSGDAIIQEIEDGYQLRYTISYTKTPDGIIPQFKLIVQIYNPT